MAATKETATAAGASAQHASGEPGERRADDRQNPYTLVYDGAITKISALRSSGPYWTISATGWLAHDSVGIRGPVADLIDALRWTRASGSLRQRRPCRGPRPAPSRSRQALPEHDAHDASGSVPERV